MGRGRNYLYHDNEGPGLSLHDNEGQRLYPLPLNPSVLLYVLA